MKKYTVRFIASLFAVFVMAQSASAARMLVPVGQVIGLEIGEDRVTVEGFDSRLGEAAREAGLKEGDRIITIDGKDIHCAEDIRRALQSSDGDVDISIVRGSSVKELELEPSITADGPKLGVFLKQGVTGIGTVTWYDPDTGKFGTLGHGVNNPRGELLNMVSGSAYQASVVSVRKGACGNPGQLMGTLQDAEPIGSLYKNTSRGIFGITDKGWSGDLMPLGSAKDVRTGAATIRSTVQGNSVQEYSVEILKVYPNTGATGRNILLKITDPQLLNITGGIVQGMSGSPIIQDGKLVGAVTHVLVNDPTTGYGIFIENMLDAAA